MLQFVWQFKAEFQDGTNNDALRTKICIDSHRCVLYALGDTPFMRVKNLLKLGKSAKCKRSAIWTMLSCEVPPWCTGLADEKCGGIYRCKGTTFSRTNKLFQIKSA